MGSRLRLSAPLIGVVNEQRTHYRNQETEYGVYRPGDALGQPDCPVHSKAVRTAIFSLRPASRWSGRRGGDYTVRTLNDLRGMRMSQGVDPSLL